MKYCKHYLIFLLAGALLLLPVTSHYAYVISWPNFKVLKEKASELVNSETLQNIAPVAVIALGVAGYMYYWLTKKDGNPIRSIVPMNYVWPTLQQFKVYCQFNWNGGGAASCGYHTLLRGMQVVASKNRNQNEMQLKNDLMSVELIENYFGENGRWRQAIIQKKPNDDRHGDWIDDGDLEYLWNNYRNDILNRSINCGFLAIPDFNVLGTSYSLLEPYIKDEVRPFLNQPREMFHIFALGTMYQTGDKSRTEGHWYPLVMHQNTAGKRQYYITDSASEGETNRLEDTNAWKIIDLIEQ